MLLTTMPRSFAAALAYNFLGNSPHWYKLAIVVFLIANPVVLWNLGSAVAGWLLVGEFIFTLAMALKCYPLQPGGLLVLQAILLGLATPQALYADTDIPTDLMVGNRMGRMGGTADIEGIMRPGTGGNRG